MGRYFNSFMDDSSEALEHSWGTSAKAKAREKEYNHWYDQKHKAEIEAVKKQRSAATNSYKQAEKSRNDAHRYEHSSNKIYDRYSTLEYSGNLEPSPVDRLDKYQKKYIKMFRDSNAKAREYKSQGDRQKAFAKFKANRILRHVKNPTVKDLVEFYLDTTIVVKAKKLAKKAANKAEKYATKAANKAEKYATEAMPTIEKAANKAEKYATKAANKAEKYATEAMPTIEKAANKAKKYATKTVKSAANKAEKYVVR